MAFQNVRELVAAENEGRTFFTTWRKQVTQNTALGFWFDLGMSSGNPVPNYYAASPAISVALSQSTDGGILHGGNVAQLGHKKFLKMFGVATVLPEAVPSAYILCDYLLFYPFMDMSITDPQPVTNTVSLPRYTDGEGVRIVTVLVAAQTGAGNPQFYVNYTNSAGVSGRQTRNAACNVRTNTGVIVSTSVSAVPDSVGPFLCLQEGDTGVRSIDSITFLTPDVGLVTLVLMRPLATVVFRDATGPAERNFFGDFANMPQIVDDAYLNLLCFPPANLAAGSTSVHGYIETVWG